MHFRPSFFLILSFLLAITLASPLSGSGSSRAPFRTTQNLRNSRKKEHSDPPKLPETKAFVTDSERDSIVETFKDDSVDPPDGDTDNNQCAVAMLPQDFPSQKRCAKVAETVYACTHQDDCGVEERVGGVSHRAQEERASEASGGVEELYEVVSGMNILMTVMGEWER
ncbi:MAG: hypothetical protein LQ351_001455 [Letrouitia transgressa]|nr:MAG: hypothetical protein LQ351_001455 [Letrouitia transgressa]